MRDGHLWLGQKEANGTFKKLDQPGVNLHGSPVTPFLDEKLRESVNEKIKCIA